MTTTDQPGVEVDFADPVAAERVDSGTCDYDCDNEAEFRVEWRDTRSTDGSRPTHLTCDDCQRRAGLHVVDNELLDYEVTAASDEGGGSA